MRIRVSLIKRSITDGALALTACNRGDVSVISVSHPTYGSCFGCLSFLTSPTHSLAPSSLSPDLGVKSAREQCGVHQRQRQPLAYSERHGSGRLEHVRVQSRAIAEAMEKELKSTMEALAAAEANSKGTACYEPEDPGAAGEQIQQQQEEGGKEETSVEEAVVYTPVLAAWALRSLQLGSLLFPEGWSKAAAPKGASRQGGQEAESGVRAHWSCPSPSPFVFPPRSPGLRIAEHHTENLEQ